MTDSVALFAAGSSDARTGLSASGLSATGAGAAGASSATAAAALIGLAIDAAVAEFGGELSEAGDFSAPACGLAAAGAGFLSAVAGFSAAATGFSIGPVALLSPAAASLSIAAGLSNATGGVVATAATVGAEAAGDELAVAGEGAAAKGDGAGRCLAIAPVTESRPCSSVVTREYSRSRSPLSVSIADASRRVSLWLSFASVCNCWACRARSAAATWSRRSVNADWLAITATVTAPTAATPHEPSRHSMRRSRASSSAKKPVVFSVSNSAARLSRSLAKARLALLKARRITRQRLTGNGPGT
ncbi:hypothetical protein [Bradyrhizobium elkanii]|uniref:hypothetical protein n=1 Tax=Bradyrhizobium elkanii TaxID=29448 RepID=UPI0035163C45